MQDGSSEVGLGLVAAPGTPAAVAAGLAEEIPALLAERLPGAAWRVEVVNDSLVTPPADDGELVNAAGAAQPGMKTTAGEVV